MKKNFFGIFIIVLIISIIIIMIQSNHTGNTSADAVEAAFDVTGAEAVSSEIYVRGAIAANVHDGMDERMILQDILMAAGVRGSGDIPVFSEIDNDYSEGREINYIIDENKSIRMTVLQDMDKSREDICRLLISFFDTSNDPLIRSHAGAIKGVLEKYGILHEMNISITGSVDGRLDENEISKICERIFKEISADMVEGINDNGLVSVSAFSPEISETVSVNGKRVNLNIAARYNSYEGKTYIWLATPVIITEY